MDIEHLTFTETTESFNTESFDTILLDNCKEFESSERNLFSFSFPLINDLDVQVSCEEAYAILTFEKEEKPISVHYCCFSEEGKYPVMQHAAKLISIFDKKSPNLILPSKSLFLYTVTKDKEATNKIYKELNGKKPEQYFFYALYRNKMKGQE